MSDSNESGTRRSSDERDNSTNTNPAAGQQQQQEQQAVGPTKPNNSADVNKQPKSHNVDCAVNQEHAAQDEEIPPVATVQVLESLLQAGRLRVNHVTEYATPGNLVLVMDDIFENDAVPGLDRGHILPENPELDPMLLFLDGVGRLYEKSSQNINASDLALLAVVGTWGTGREEFLDTIASRLDTERPRYTNNDNRGTDYRALLRAKLAVSQSAAAAAAARSSSSCASSKACTPAQFNEHVVVMRAKFHDGLTNFHRYSDTATNIVNRTVSRMLNEYFFIPVPGRRGRRAWHQFENSNMDFVELAAFMRRFVASKYESDAGNNNTRMEPAVIFCIDGLRKFDDIATRNELLSEVASSQDIELRCGSPTFFVVSSIDVGHMVDPWMKLMHHSMCVIPLPLLHLGPALRERLYNLNKKCDPSLWSEYVDAMLDSAGGHPTKLRHVVEAIMQARSQAPSEWPDRFPSSESYALIALAIFQHSFRFTATGRECIVDHSKVCFDEEVRPDDCTSFAALVYRDTISYSALPVQLVNNEPQCNLRLSVAPGTFFSFLRAPRRGMTSNTDKALLNNAIDVRNAVWSFSEVAAYEKFVKGVIAALALVARAHLDCNGRNPTLGEVLRGAQFCSEELAHWQVPIQSRFNISDVSNSQDDDVLSSLWCSNAESNSIENSEVLARVAKASKEAEINGTIELLCNQGHRAMGGIQMQLRIDWTADRVHDKTNRALRFTQEETAAAAQTPSCVLLFCSGESATFNSKLNGRNIVLIGTRACKALLGPFGASVLLKKLRRME